MKGILVYFQQMWFLSYNLGIDSYLMSVFPRFVYHMFVILTIEIIRLATNGAPGAFTFFFFHS